MFNRVELKANGKRLFQANYLMCCIAAFLLLLTGVGQGLSNPTTFIYSIRDKFMSESTDNLMDSIVTTSVNNKPVILSGELANAGLDDFLIGLSVFFVVMLLFFSFIIVVISVLILNPLQVGARKFFIDNSYDTTTKLSKDNIGLALQGNYWNLVGSMFVTQLFTFLWSLLLIVPGIYKSYCWRLVPYILADNPNISGESARRISQRLMDGNKWNTFILDLSFIGWYLLGAVTCGLLSILWVNPYYAATNAELYLELSSKEANIY